MKKAIAAVLVGATLLSSTTAFAADHGNRGHGRGHDSRQWNGGSSHQWNGGDYRQGGSHYRQGQRYPYYNQSRYVIRDYRAYRLPPPRSGYQYYRSDNGDIVMAAIASGIIGLIIGSALNDNHNDGYYNQGYGYAPPPQPYYPPAPYYPPPRPYYGY